MYTVTTSSGVMPIQPASSDGLAISFARWREVRVAPDQTQHAHAERAADHGARADQPGAALHARPFASAMARAAAWIACRTRGYVPQRQMFVMAASMSASVGAAFCASRALAAMIIPDWQ